MEFGGYYFSSGHEGSTALELSRPKRAYSVLGWVRWYGGSVALLQADVGEIFGSCCGLNVPRRFIGLSFWCVANDTGKAMELVGGKVSVEEVGHWGVRLETS